MSKTIIAYLHEISTPENPKRLTFKTYDTITAHSSGIWKSGDFTYLCGAIDSIYATFSPELIKYMFTVGIDRLVNQQLYLTYSMSYYSYYDKKNRAVNSGYRVVIEKVNIFDIMETF